MYNVQILDGNFSQTKYFGNNIKLFTFAPRDFLMS